MNSSIPPQSDPNAFDDPTSLGVVQAMIKMAYQVAVDPDRFEDLIDTWDAFFAEAASSPNFLLLAEHFEQAAIIAVDPRVDRSQDLTAVLDLIAAPAILVDQKGCYLTGNTGGRQVLQSSGPGTPLASQFAGDWRPASEDETSHFQFRSEAGQTLMAACKRIPIPHDSDAHYVIRFAASQWTDQLSDTLRNTYGLTDTEIEVARLLHLGKSPAEIGTARNRSLETIRTQIKSLMIKTDTRKQAGLIQFLSHLHYVAGARTEDTPVVAATKIDRSGFVIRQTTMPCGRTLASSWYGDPLGKTVIYLTTSSRPEETAAWRQAVHKARLRVIAIHRPGFGGSDTVGAWDRVADYIAQACSILLGADFDEPLLLAGHREGGILAAEVGVRLASDHTLAGVVLLSTGAPETDLTPFDAASDTTRRSLAAVHTLPGALRLGYKAARRVFNSGTMGERQIVSYFFKGSPRDSSVVRDPELWQAIRDNIAYSFENTDIIVDDFGRWTSNWAGTIASGKPEHPRWIFIHGTEHDFMQADRVTAFCAAKPGCEYHMIEKSAQMMLYVQSEKVAALMQTAFAS